MENALRIYASVIVSIPVVLIVSYLFGSFSNRVLMRFLLRFVGLGAVFLSGLLLFVRYTGTISLFLGHILLSLDPRTVAVFGLCSILMGIVSRFSYTYLLGDAGYWKFFLNIFLFWSGLFLFVFGERRPNLLVGWEWMAVSSIFLIAYYCRREASIYSALNVLVFYKMADIFLLLALMSLSHLSVIYESPLLLPLVYTFIVIAGLIKSSSFPFTSWLPRAMEGPTPSSAVYYAAISVNAGVILIWKFLPEVRSFDLSRWTLFGGACGTILYSSFQSRLQSDIKSSLAYASSIQIGIVLLELAFGWADFALFHLFANSFLKTYQFLRSPSVLDAHRFGGGSRRGIFASLISERTREKFYFLLLNHLGVDAIYERLAWVIELFSRATKFILFSFFRFSWRSWGRSAGNLIFLMAIYLLILFFFDAQKTLLQLLIVFMIFIGSVLIFEKNARSFGFLFLSYKGLEIIFAHSLHVETALLWMPLLGAGVFVLLFEDGLRSYIQKKWSDRAYAFSVVFFMLFNSNFPIIFSGPLDELFVETLMVKKNFIEGACYAVASAFVNIALYRFVFEKLYLSIRNDENRFSGKESKECGERPHRLGAVLSELHKGVMR